MGSLLSFLASITCSCPSVLFRSVRDFFPFVSSTHVVFAFHSHLLVHFLFASSSFRRFVSISFSCALFFSSSFAMNSSCCRRCCLYSRSCCCVIVLNVDVHASVSDNPANFACSTNLLISFLVVRL